MSMPLGLLLSGFRLQAVLARRPWSRSPSRSHLTLTLPLPNGTHPPGMQAPAAKQEAMDGFASRGSNFTWSSVRIIPSHPIPFTRAVRYSVHHVTIIQPLAHWRSSDGGSRVTTVSHNPGDLPDLDSHDPSPRGLDTRPAEHSYSVKCFSLCPQFGTSAS